MRGAGRDGGGGGGEGGGGERGGIVAAVAVRAGAGANDSALEVRGVD